MHGSFHVCPYCKGPYTPPDIHADLDRNCVVIEGKSIKTTPRVAEIMSVLYESYPMGASKDHIIARIWGASGGPECRQTLSVHMAALRKAISVTGWKVIKPRIGNYQLTKP